MALKIRMARGGAKKRPSYRIVVTDSRNARDGKFIEKLGTHNPFLDHANPQRVVVDIERVKYWLSVGAKSSDRLNSYFSKMGLEESYTKFAQTKKNQPRQKAQERLKAEADRQQAALEAEKAAQEAAIAAAAEPVTEAVVEETVVDNASVPEASVEVAAEPLLEESVPDVLEASDDESADAPSKEVSSNETESASE